MSTENEDEDATDIFDTALSSLFSVPPIAFSTSSPASLHTYIAPVRAHGLLLEDGQASTDAAGAVAPATTEITVPDPLMPPFDRDESSTIQLQLCSPPDHLYTQLQANHLWLSAVFLADRIALGLLDLRGLLVAELGAGAGLPGIAAFQQGAHVVGTDYDIHEVIDVLRANFRRNAERNISTGIGNGTETGDVTIAGSRPGAGSWAVVGHTWGTDPSAVYLSLSSFRDSTSPRQAGDKKQFDALLLADTLWMTDSHSILLESVFALLRPGGTAHIAAGLHTGRGPIGRFIRLAEEEGATVIPMCEVQWNNGQWVEHREHETGLEEERGVVVYYTLHL